jgi:hypothetical protein
MWRQAVVVVGAVVSGVLVAQIVGVLEDDPAAASLSYSIGLATTNPEAADGSVAIVDEPASDFFGTSPEDQHTEVRALAEAGLRRPRFWTLTVELENSGERRAEDVRLFLQIDGLVAGVDGPESARCQDEYSEDYSALTLDCDQVAAGETAVVEIDLEIAEVDTGTARDNASRLFGSTAELLAVELLDFAEVNNCETARLLISVPAEQVFGDAHQSAVGTTVTSTLPEFISELVVDSEVGTASLSGRVAVVVDTRYGGGSEPRVPGSLEFSIEPLLVGEAAIPSLVVPDTSSDATGTGGFSLCPP